MKMLPAGRGRATSGDYRRPLAVSRRPAAGCESGRIPRGEEDSPREGLHVGHVRVDFETLLGASLCLRLQVMRQAGR